MKVERFAGVMTAFLGIGGALIALFAPLNSNEECSATHDGASNCVTWSTSLWQDDRGDATRALAMIAALALLAGLGAVVDTQSAKRHRLLLFAVAALLCVLTLLSMFSIGLFVLPATLAALVASTAALVRRDRTPVEAHAVRR